MTQSRLVLAKRTRVVSLEQKQEKSAVPEAYPGPAPLMRSYKLLQSHFSNEGFKLIALPSPGQFKGSSSQDARLEKVSMKLYNAYCGWLSDNAKSYSRELYKKDRESSC